MKRRSFRGSRSRRKSFKKRGNRRRKTTFKRTYTVPRGGIRV